MGTPTQHPAISPVGTAQSRRALGRRPRPPQRRPSARAHHPPQAHEPHRRTTPTSARPRALRCVLPTSPYPACRLDHRAPPAGPPPTAPAQTAERACRRPTRPGSLYRPPHARQPLPVVAPDPISTPLPSSRPAPTHRRHGSPTQRHTPAEGQDGPAPPRTALLTVTVPQRHCDGPRRLGTSGSDRRQPGWTAPPTAGSQHPTAQPPTGTAPCRRTGTCAVGVHDAQDPLCTAPRSSPSHMHPTRRPAIVRPTGLSGPAQHLGCCRGPPAASSPRCSEPAGRGGSPAGPSQPTTEGRRCQIYRRRNDGSAGGGAKARRISREVNASKDAVSNLRLEGPNTGITGALMALRGSCAGELPFVVRQPQIHRASR